MDETKKPDDRWRELADLLGLPDEKSAGKSEPAAAPPRRVEASAPPPPPAPKVEETPPPMVRFEPEAAPAPPEIVEEWEPDDLEGDATEVDETELPFEDGPPVAPGAGPPAPGAEGDEPRRGRRRRRRGRRRGGDRPEGDGPREHAAPPATPGARETPGADKETSVRPPRDAESGPRDQRGGRGRGRNRGRDRDDDHRRRPAPPPPAERDELEPLDDEVRDEPQPAARDDHALAAEDTDFSNWNVPSWQDLIASLHRPDR